MALLIGIPLGLWGGRAYADFAAATLNFEIASYGVDGWVYLVQIVAALLIPVIGAAVPVYKGSRITVREARSNSGISGNVIGSRPIDALLGRVQEGRTFLLAQQLPPSGTLALDTPFAGYRGSGFYGRPQCGRFLE